MVKILPADENTVRNAGQLYKTHKNALLMTELMRNVTYIFFKIKITQLCKLRQI